MLGLWCPHTSFNSTVRICSQEFSVTSRLDPHSCNHRNRFPSLPSKYNMKKRKINSADFRFMVQVNVGCWKQLLYWKATILMPHVVNWGVPMGFMNDYTPSNSLFTPTGHKFNASWCVGVLGSAEIVWTCLISHLWHFEQGRYIIIDASSEEELQNLHQTQVFKPLSHSNSNPLEQAGSVSRPCLNMSRNTPRLAKWKKKPTVKLLHTPAYLTFLNSVSFQGKISPVLKEAHVGILPPNLCNSSEGYAGLMNNKALCAGVWAGGTDTCQVRREVVPHLPQWNSQARGSAASWFVAWLIKTAEILTGKHVKCKGSIIKGLGQWLQSKNIHKEFGDIGKMTGILEQRGRIKNTTYLCH